MTEQLLANTEATPTIPTRLDIDENTWLELYNLQDTSTILGAVKDNYDFFEATIPGMAPDFVNSPQQIIELMVANTQAGKSAPYKIMHRGEFKGAISYRSREGSSAIMGYWLVENAQGQGLATAAAKRMIQFGHNWGLTEVKLEINRENSRSIATAKRIGAVLVGSNPKDEDEDIWSIAA